MVFTVGEGAVDAGALGTALAVVLQLAGALALVAGALVPFDLQAVTMTKKMKAIRYAVLDIRTPAGSNSILHSSRDLNRAIGSPVTALSRYGQTRLRPLRFA